MPAETDASEGKIDRDRVLDVIREQLAEILEVDAAGIGVYFAILIAFFAVLFTGKWPEGLRDFVVKFFRWATRVNAYVLLRDEYPPFSLD